VICSSIWQDNRNSYRINPDQISGKAISAFPQRKKNYYETGIPEDEWRFLMMS
jgi:hypothetical protein